MQIGKLMVQSLKLEIESAGTFKPPGDKLAAFKRGPILTIYLKNASSTAPTLILVLFKRIAMWKT